MTGFTFVTTTTSTTAGGNRREVDWDALNQHVIDAAKTAEKSRSIPGVISGIIDLGEQDLEDAEQVFVGTPEQEAKLIEEKPATYFKDGVDDKGKPCRLKCWPQKPVQQVCITVDFPQVMVDKGQFFGNSQPQPLRLLLNREFTLPGDKVKIVASPYNIRETKYDDGTWAFAKNNGLHKLADACGILDSKGYFTKARIGELLGKVAQFQFQVFMKPSKNGGSFFQENIKLVGMVPEGVTLPDVSEVPLYGINLYAPNDPAAIKQLRANIKNHIKRANNYEGSVLKGELEALEAGNAPQATPAAKPEGVAPATPAKAEDDDSFDDDAPF